MKLESQSLCAVIERKREEGNGVALKKDGDGKDMKVRERERGRGMREGW